MSGTFLIISPFLGPLPSYTQLFLDSCRYVPSADFLVLTDHPWEALLAPPNVTLAKISSSEIEERIKAKLHLKADLSRGYKLCDLKPMLGSLFPEYLEGYLYGGVCDLDLIFSNSLENTLQQVIKKEPDVAYLHSQYAHGAFFLYKNSPDNLELYRKSRDWRDVVTCDHITGFDECGNKYDALASVLEAPNNYTKGKKTFLDLTVDQLLGFQNFECMTVVLLREHLRRGLKLFLDHRAKEGLRTFESLCFKEGVLTDSQGEAWDYYHWVMDKTRRKWHYPGFKQLPDEFYVTQYGMFLPHRPFRNTLIHAVRFLRALLLISRDRACHAFKKLGAKIGLNQPPPPFR